MPPKEISSVAVKMPVFKRIFNKKIIVRTLFALAFLFAVGAACYFYSQTVALKKTTQQATDQELKETIAKISRLILLPKDETPTIASVSDPAQLKNQPFFDNAEIGDKVLIYSKAKEAVLYRPKTNMIINFAPVNLGGAETGVGESASTNANTNASPTKKQ
jgi:hypothetical protein